MEGLVWWVFLTFSLVGWVYLLGMLVNVWYADFFQKIHDSAKKIYATVMALITKGLWYVLTWLLAVFVGLGGYIFLLEVVDTYIIDLS